MNTLSTQTYNHMSSPAVSPTIFVIEDDPAIQMFLNDALTDEGYHVLCLDSGAQALQTIEALHPDLILLDVCLPDIDGYTICEHIRSSAAAHLPILMVSGNCDSRDVLNAFHVGADDYVRKPFDVNELLIQVRALLPTPDFA